MKAFAFLILGVDNYFEAKIGLSTAYEWATMIEHVMKKKSVSACKYCPSQSELIDPTISIKNDNKRKRQSPQIPSAKKPPPPHP